MRALLFVVAIGAAAVAVGDGSLQECADIESAVERLDCYDRLARRRADESAATASGRPASARAVEPQVPDSAPVLEAPRPEQGRRADRGAAADDFGLENRRQSEHHTQEVTAHIENVRKAPLGQQIMTLSNGQVWMETEPGRRPIASGQTVTIRKQLLHYEMELESQPDVAVRRVE